MIIILVLYYLGSSISLKVVDPSSHGQTVASSRSAEIDYTLIGAGPLRLSKGGQSGYLDEVIDSLMYISSPSRPSSIRDAALLSIRGSKHYFTLPIKKRLFLDRDEDGALAFSKTPGGVALTIHRIDANYIKGVVEERLPKRVRKEFTLVCGRDTSFDRSVRAKMEKIDAFTHFLKAKLWGNDTLFALYGGQEYARYASVAKLEIPHASGSHMYYLAPGDTLIWDEDRWITAEDESLSKQAPLMRVESFSSGVIHLRAWDQKGFFPLDLYLQAERSSPPTLSVDKVFEQLRLRTSTQATCRLGKRRVILKEGDWWLKGELGWQNIKTVQEMQACIEHEIRGDLFVFDKIKRQASKAFICGHLFNEMRTQNCYVEIPVISERKATRAQPMMSRDDIHERARRSVEILQSAINDEDDDE